MEYKHLGDYIREVNVRNRDLKDLRLSTDFTDADIRRLEPYVEY